MTFADVKAHNSKASHFFQCNTVPGFAENYNGLIQAATWHSKKTASDISITPGINAPRTFGYKYNDKYQFTESTFAMPDFTNDRDVTIVENEEKHYYENTSYLVMGTLTLKPGFHINAASDGEFFAMPYQGQENNYNGSFPVQLTGSMILPTIRTEI